MQAEPDLRLIDGSSPLMSVDQDSQAEATKVKRRKISIKNPASPIGAPSRKMEEENKDNSSGDVVAVASSSAYESRRGSPMKKQNSASKSISQPSKLHSIRQ